MSYTAAIIIAYPLCTAPSFIYVPRLCPVSVQARVSRTRAIRASVGGLHVCWFAIAGDVSIIDTILRDKRRFAHVSGDSFRYAGRGMVILW